MQRTRGPAIIDTSMRSFFHSSANYVAAKFMKLLFGSVARVHVLRSENADGAGGFLRSSNHISHLDPFIFSVGVRRNIDWIAMGQFFPLAILGLCLRGVDGMPTSLDRADPNNIRTA